jgi:hypothetical protein
MRSLIVLVVGLVCGTALGDAVPAHQRRLQKSGAEGWPLCVVDELAPFWDSGSGVVDVNGLSEVLCSVPPELDVSTCSDAELASIAEAKEAMCTDTAEGADSEPAPAPTSCWGMYADQWTDDDGNTHGCTDTSIECPCGCWPSGVLLLGGRAGTPCSCYNPICVSMVQIPPPTQPGTAPQQPPGSPAIAPSPATLACKQATCSDWCTTHACTDWRPCPIGEFVAQCDELGGFMPVQCDGSVGNCWCVDEQGEEIAGTNMMCRGGTCAVTPDGCLAARQGIQASRGTTSGEM